VDEEGRPPVLLLDGVLRCGTAGADTEDRARADPRGGVDLVRSERASDAGVRRAEALGPAGLQKKEGEKFSLLDVDIRYNEFVFCILLYDICFLASYCT
jgi:hypothetical protein